MQDSVTTPGRNGLARALWVAAPLAIFLAVAALFLVALNSGDPSKLPSTLIGRPAPAAEFSAIDGLTDGTRAIPGFTTAELAKGKVSVVNFWASWCTPCIAEHPELLELKGRTGIDIYGVNYKDEPSAARRFIGRYGNPFTAVGADAKGRAAIDWGVYGVPETYVVNGRGEIAYKHVGPITRQSLLNTLIPAIEAVKGK